MDFQVPRGTKDILPQEALRWQDVEEKSRQVFFRYNYSEIRTPIFENINLFQRSLGDTTEIVQKQMFSFTQGDDQLVLRPEATAAIARAYLEHSLGFGVKLQKLFYIGPIFRAERPQKGRQRQFHHIGVEAIGSSSPHLDVEIIELANQLLCSLGIAGYTFIVNSLGCKNDKAQLAELLKSRLAKHKNELCADCQDRLARNVFRVLDCKNEQCRGIVDGLSIGHSHLCQTCKTNFDTIIQGLNHLGIKHAINEKLVRGLDYYSGLVFEVVHPDLGAQDALGAGGRYDYLFEALAGKQIGAIGFAFGVERLMLAMSELALKAKLDVYIVPIGQKAAGTVMPLASQIRAAGFSCDVDYSDASLKSMLKEANRLEAKYALIIGDDELEVKKATLRSMQESKEEKVEFSSIVSKLQVLIKGK